MFARSAIAGNPPISKLQPSDRSSGQLRASASSTFTHLVTVSCTGFHAPGPEVTLIDDLGLSPEVGRVSVGFMGCHGAFNGLRMADSIVRAEPAALVLVSIVALLTRPLIDLIS